MTALARTGTRPLVVGAVAALLALACLALPTGAPTGRAPTPASAATGDPARPSLGSSGAWEAAYRDAHRSCASAGVSYLHQRFGVSGGPPRLAAAFARFFPPSVRRPAFRGCLDGLRHG